VELFCGSVSLGTYTIASTTGGPPATSLTTTETIITSHSCGSASTITVTRVSNVLTSDKVDFSEYSSVLTAGTAVELGTTAIPSTVLAVYTDYIILDNFRSMSSYTTLATVAASSLAFKLDGRGTEENDECSGRGMCNSEEGICECFSGYTGDACSIQSALSA